MANQQQIWRERLRNAEHDVIAAVARGRDLTEVLELACRRFEDLEPGALCSILLLDASRTRLITGAAPGLPKEYSDALHGLAIGPEVGSCGTAAFTRRRVIVTDIRNDPKWVNFRDLARAHGLAACWSIPLLGAADMPIGTFAIYRRAPHNPTESEIEAASLMSDAVAVAIARGIDRQKLVEARLKAESANIAKSQFLTHLSHEFRTPLNAIIGFSDLMRVSGTSNQDRISEYSGIIGQSGRVLLELIDGLLDLARVEAGDVSIDDGVFTVNDVLTNCIAIATPPTDQRIARITVDDKAQGVKLAADHRAVTRMALNLVSNAVKYTPAEGRVELVVERDSRGLVISVRDDGPGIPEDDLPRLGQPFARGSSLATRRVAGTGLGLFITKSLIELHGGSFSIRNRPSGGAEASIIFPTHRVFLGDQAQTRGS